MGAKKNRTAKKSTQDVLEKAIQAQHLCPLAINVIIIIIIFYIIIIMNPLSNVDIINIINKSNLSYCFGGVL